MKRAMPRAKNCFYCGTDNADGLNLTYYFEENRISTKFTPDRKYKASESFMSPGVILGAVIEAMAWVPTCIMQKPVISLGVEVRTFKPVPVDTSLNITAEAVSVNPWLSEVKAEVKDDEGNMFYTIKGKFTVTPTEFLDLYEHYPENYCYTDNQI
ncbi:MAG: hypothetical protein N3B21_00510 [Clostridia bacterium]|nr:hypothetical protein [Clostridia bacterium]